MQIGGRALANSSRLDTARWLLTRRRLLWADYPPSNLELRDLRLYVHGWRMWFAVRRGGYTLLGCRRGRTLHRLAVEVERGGTPGALVDAGTWKGGSAVLLSLGAPSREAWAFDSFEGMPEPQPVDGREGQEFRGKLKASPRDVGDAFRRFADPRCLRLVEGRFEDSFPRTRDEISAISVLHSDAGLYDAVMLTLETFYDRISPGGYAVVNHWAGARQATSDFRQRHGISAPLVDVDGLAAYWRKPPLDTN
jgi:O-methyltransferase